MRFSTTQQSSLQSDQSAFQVINYSVIDIPNSPGNLRYVIDTSAPRTLNLPTNPLNGHTITIIDGGPGGFTANNTTVVRTAGNTIGGVFENLVLDSSNGGAQLIFTNGDWKVFLL
jgi:hypothetical protein